MTYEASDMPVGARPAEIADADAELDPQALRAEEPPETSQAIGDRDEENRVPLGVFAIRGANEDKPAEDTEDNDRAEPFSGNDRQPQEGQPPADLPELGPGSNEGQGPPTDKMPPVGDEGDKSDPAQPFNKVFAGVAGFNEHVARGNPLGDFFADVVAKERVRNDLEDAGLDPEEVERNIDAVEGDAQRDDFDKEMLGLQMESDLHKIGIGLSVETKIYVEPVITDGGQFAQALADVEPEDLSEDARKGLDNLTAASVKNIVHWTWTQSEASLTEQYPDAVEIFEAVPPHPEIDASAPHILAETLQHAHEYEAELSRLDLGRDSAPLLAAMADAAKEGLLPDMTLLYQAGVVYTDRSEYENGFFASWEPEEWRLVDDIVARIATTDQGSAVRTYLDEHLRTVIDESIAIFSKESVIPEYVEPEDEEGYSEVVPEEVMPPDWDMVAALREKRELYHRQLGS